tara:strand:+ start:4831 stop:5217 length:387 start_codon:yes stop_codon:yes gene_type:complete
VPEKAKVPRYQSRVAVYPPIPDGAQSYLELLFDIGPTVPAGMGGLAVIPEVELMAWQVNRGVVLTPHECEVVRRLSSAYASSAMESRGAMAPPPFTPQAPEDMSAKARDAISEAMEKMADAHNAQMRA